MRLQFKHRFQWISHQLDAKMRQLVIISLSNKIKMSLTIIQMLDITAFHTETSAERYCPIADKQKHCILGTSSS